jgi:hypothetical protein
VLKYKRADGTVVRELRRPEQVFRAESIASLADAPLTDLHPREMVTPKNARTLAVGHVSGASARPDGRYVEAEVVVTDGAMIDAIEQGTRREVSCGYSCKLLQGGGVYNGEHYDAEQTEIVYNHAGLGPPQWGRAGSEVALRLDGERAELELGAEDACALDAIDEPQNRPRGKSMDTVTIRVDGIDIAVPPQSAQLITRTLEQGARDAEQRKADATKLQERIDALQAELDTAKTNLAEATDGKRFDAAVAARLALLERVRPHLGAEVKLDGVSEREVKERTLKHLVKDIDLAGKSDAYVDARFDSVLEQQPKQTPSKGSNLDDARRKLRGDGGGDGGGGSSAPAYRTPAWRTPLRATSRKADS